MDQGTTISYLTHFLGKASCPVARGKQSKPIRNSAYDVRKSERRKKKVKKKFSPPVKKQ